MQPNHGNVNHRHSRRSACDHCRAYKLRCERDSSVGISCNRCLMNQMSCTTTVNHSSQRRPYTGAQLRTEGPAKKKPTADITGRDTSNSNTITKEQPRLKEPRPAATRTSQFSSTVPQELDKPPSRTPPLPRLQTQLAVGEELINGSLQDPYSERQPDSIIERTVDIMPQHMMDGGESILLDQDCLVGLLVSTSSDITNEASEHLY